MSDPIRRPGAVAAIVGMPVATALAILLVYAEWRDVAFPTFFLRTFNRFPWVRCSLLLTLITCLAGIAGAGRRSGSTILGSSFTYAAVIVPIAFIVVYPGPEVLGFFADGSMYPLLLMLIVIHTFGFRAVRNAVEDSELES